MANEVVAVDEMTQASAVKGRVREQVGDVVGCVVVGVDGSACSDQALRFAAHEAELRRCPLIVVRAWSITTAPRRLRASDGVVPPLSVYESAVASAMSDEVVTVLGEQPVCQVELRPVHDSAVDVLVAATEHAALTVVGSRCHTVVSGLLGSVSEHVVRHARGPVTVVH